MKYNCNACGKYVEAGSGHTCYEGGPPLTELERLRCLADSYRRDLDRERKRIRELEAEVDRLREDMENNELVHNTTINTLRRQRSEQEAENKRMRKLLREALNGNQSFAWAGRTTKVLEGTDG